MWGCDEVGRCLVLANTFVCCVSSNYNASSEPVIKHFEKLFMYQVETNFFTYDSCPFVGGYNNYFL